MQNFQPNQVIPFTSVMKTFTSVMKSSAQIDKKICLSTSLRNRRARQVVYNCKEEQIVRVRPLWISPVHKKKVYPLRKNQTPHQPIKPTPSIINNPHKSLAWVTKNIAQWERRRGTQQQSFQKPIRNCSPK